MTLSTEDYLAAIAHHSAGLADAARGSLDARVEHCPGWDVADLVWHVRQVHWFWATIADERLPAPPDESRRPSRPERDDLVADVEAGARRLVEVLGRADQAAACWTWAPQAQHVGFVTRHQVQEAAVHHWDAVNAVGGTLEIDGTLASDAVEEFLTYSVSSAEDPADPPRPALDGALWICACVTSGDSPTWLVTDGPAPGTVAWRRVPGGVAPTDLAGDVPMAAGHADPAEVLLWLYGRRTSPWGAGGSGYGDESVLARFAALTYTD